MRVLLIRPFINIFSELRRIGGLYEPVNLMYLGAVLKKHGHTAFLIDYEVESFDLAKLCSFIRLNGIELVGITTMTPSYPSGCLIARLIKKVFPQINIVFGGIHATLLYGEVLKENPYVDFVVRGEGDITFPELLTALQSGSREDIERVKGVSFRVETQIVNNADRDLIQDLDNLPFPDRSLIDRSKYTGPLAPGLYRSSNKRPAEVYTSRGCPYQCKFCSIHFVMGNRCRLRSLQNVLAEIDDLVQNQGYNYIFFHDDNFTLSKPRVLAFCKELVKRRIKWSCLSRVDLIDEETIRAMKLAGCEKIAFGVESGSLRVLRHIRKQITPVQVVKAFTLAQKYKIITQAYLMIGHPTETVEDVLKSIALIKRINPDFIFASMVTAFPGTELFDEAIQKGFIKKGDWSEFLFFPHEPASRSDHFSKQELYYWQRKILTAFYFRISYLWHKVLSLKTPQDVLYYIKATFAFLSFVIRPYKERFSRKK